MRQLPPARLPTQRKKRTFTKWNACKCCPMTPILEEKEEENEEQEEMIGQVLGGRSSCEEE